MHALIQNDVVGFGLSLSFSRWRRFEGTGALKIGSAIHHFLTPAGGLLAVLGYAIGTYAVWLCGQLLRMAAAS